MNLGRAIRLCRTQRGFSQVDLAQKIGVSPAYISLIESGKRDVSLSTVQLIAEALYIPTSILVFLGTDPGELKRLPSDLREKLAHTALQLMRHREP